MSNMMHVILYAIVPIIVVMLAGYISGKRGAFTGEDAKKFNKVVLVYALPAALFVSIVQASREMLARDIKLTLISLVGIMLCFMIVYWVFKYCFKKNTGADAAVSALISGSPTIGFLGLFLMNASLEKENPGSAKKQSAWKPVLHALAQPVAWAPILAVVWVLVGIPWPDWASPSFDLIKGANASMAVFSAGITLSAIKIQINWQAVLGSILKMVLMPAVILIMGLVFKMDPLNLKMLVVAAALPPAFSGIIIADEYDTYVATGTSSLTLSVILFVGFCPLWIWITDMCLTHF